MQLNRLPERFIAGEDFDPEKLEKSFDDLLNQLNNMLNAKATKTITGYISSTSAGSPTELVTIEINEYGIVKTLV